MNPALTAYHQHYIEARKSANEAIKHMNDFGEHFSQLSYEDRNTLFQQIIADQAISETKKQILHILFYGCPN